MSFLEREVAPPVAPSGESGLTAVKVVIGTVAAAAVAQAAPRAAQHPVIRRRPGRLRGRGHSEHLALTFDDGPDPRSTPLFLDKLAELGVHATFFVLGTMAVRAPELLTRMSREGHQVAVHGWDHRANTLTRTPHRVRGDLQRVRALVADRTGSVPRLYRPPYGILSGASLWGARSLGMRTVLWTASGADWIDGATTSGVLAALAPDLVGGATVLLHDSDCVSAPGAWRAALGALEPLVAAARSDGLTVGPLSQHHRDFR